MKIITFSPLDRPPKTLDFIEKLADQGAAVYAVGQSKVREQEERALGSNNCQACCISFLIIFGGSKENEIQIKLLIQNCRVGFKAAFKPEFQIVRSIYCFMEAEEKNQPNEPNGK